MTDTIESIHNIFGKRFSILIECCTELRDDVLLREVESLQTKYILETSTALVDYYEKKDESYYEIIGTLNIEGNLQSLYQSMRLKVKDNRTIGRIIREYNSRSINHFIEKQKEICDCGIEFSDILKGSHTACPNCGIMKKHLTVNTLYNSVHSGGHNNEEYFDDHFKRALGEGPTPHDTLQADLEKITSHIYENDIFRLSNVGKVRHYLTQVGLSKKYNDYAAYVKYKVNRTQPPTLPKSEHRAIMRRVPRILKKWTELSPDKNIPYPYIAWKLVELFVSDRDMMLEILSNIYLPSDANVRKKDVTWEKVITSEKPYDKDLYYQSTDKRLII